MLQQNALRYRTIKTSCNQTTCCRMSLGPSSQALGVFCIRMLYTEHVTDSGREMEVLTN